MKPTTIAIAATFALTALTACSEDAAPATSLAPLDPVATSASSTAPPPSVTVATRVTASAPSTTTATSAAAASSSTTSPAPAGLYAKVAGPRLPDKTTAIDPSWLEPNGARLRGVADGQYWGTPTGTGTGAKQFVDLQLVQALFGGACTARFGTGEDACNNDYGTVDSPSGSFPAYVDTPYVTVVDEATKQSYLIDGPELFALVGRGAGAVNAPPDYFFVPFPFLVTVKDSVVVSLEQVWVP